MRGKRSGRGEGKGGQEASRSADSATTKPAATEAAGGPAAGSSTSSDPRRVDPLREGVNAWFKAAAAWVQLHDKLVGPLDQELVNMHNGGFWLGQPVADPNIPGAMIPPPPFEMNDANRHRSLPFYSETAPTAPAAAVAAHKSALTWVRAFYAYRRALPGNVLVEGRRVGAGGATLVTSPTLADYAAERLSNMEEVINILNAVYPGAERKLLRTSAMARLAELNKWAAAMLKAMPKVLKTDCGVQAEYEAVMLSGDTGTDPEFQRRGATGLELYKLNFVASLAMARAPGAQQASVNRAKDWAIITRAKTQTQHEWRAKLTELGQQQQPPLTPEDRDWKLRFISGSSLGAATPDFFRAFKWRARADTDDQLLATSATDLAAILGDLLAASGSAATATPSKTDGQANPPGGKAGLKKAALVARVVAATAKAVLATQASAAVKDDFRDPSKRERKRKSRDDPSSDEEEEPISRFDQATMDAAIKSVLVAQRADAKDAKDAKKSRKGAAQLRGSKGDSETSD